MITLQHNAINAARYDPCNSSQFEYGTSNAIVQGPAITYILLTRMTPTQLKNQRRSSIRRARYSCFMCLQWAIRSQDTYHKPWVCSTISHSDSSATCGHAATGHSMQVALESTRRQPLARHAGDDDRALPHLGDGGRSGQLHGHAQLR